MVDNQLIQNMFQGIGKLIDISPDILVPFFITSFFVGGLLLIVHFVFNNNKKAFDWWQELSYFDKIGLSIISGFLALFCGFLWTAFTEIIFKTNFHYSDKETSVFIIIFPILFYGLNQYFTKEKTFDSFKEYLKLLNIASMIAIGGIIINIFTLFALTQGILGRIFYLWPLPFVLTIIFRRKIILIIRKHLKN